MLDTHQEVVEKMEMKEEAEEGKGTLGEGKKRWRREKRRR